MPIRCPGNEKPRYRARKTSKGTQRIVFCGSSAVEVKNLDTGKVSKVEKKIGGKLGR